MDQNNTIVNNPFFVAGQAFGRFMSDPYAGTLQIAVPIEFDFATTMKILLELDNNFVCSLTKNNDNGLFFIVSYHVKEEENAG